MAFDRSNTIDLQQLYDERTINPISMTYPTNDNQFIKVINDPNDNVGGETIGRVFNVASLLDALDPQNFDAQQTVTDAAVYTQTLVTASQLEGVDIAPYKAKWRNMFAANSSTVVALDAQTTPLSRTEVLWGEGTSLVSDDWVAARIFVEGA